MGIQKKKISLTLTKAIKMQGDRHRP